MESKKAVLFSLRIVAVILGVALFKQFDFEKLRFEKPALAVVYLVVFVVSVYLLVKEARNNPKT